MKKKILILSCLILIVIGVLVLSYFTYWREPKAAYLKTDDATLIEIREDLAKYKASLKKKGLYRCCIRNDCNWCAIYMGHCPCEDLVSKVKPEKSCPECAAAWNKKQGKIPGVDPDAIEVTTFGIYGFEEGAHSYKGTDTHREPHHSHHEKSDTEFTGFIEGGKRIVEVKAFRYGFDPDPIIVKQGEKVRLEVTGTDVVHGLGIHEYDVNLVAPVGQKASVEFTAKEAGNFDIHCSVYCGSGHGDMHGTLIVKE